MHRPPYAPGKDPANGNGHASDGEEDLQNDRSHAKAKMIPIGHSVAEGSERHAQVSCSLYGICDREKSRPEQMNGEPNEESLETRVAMVLQGNEERRDPGMKNTATSCQEASNGQRFPCPALLFFFLFFFLVILMELWQWSR